MTQKSGRLGTTNYLYDGDNAIHELDQSGSIVASYIQGPGVDDPLSQSRVGVTSFYEQDGVGSISSLTNGAGEQSQSYLLDSYGKLTSSSGAISNPLQYAGREFDKETGIYFNRARYYDPSGGRFISEDPSGFSGRGINFYGYAANRPTKFGDAFGLSYSTYQSVIAPMIDVNVSITIYGPGASDALAAQWQQWIVNTWNNNPGIGKCTVSFNVHINFDPNETNRWNGVSNPEFPGANNFIYVPSGMPFDPSINIGNWSGTIPANTLSYSVAHEFGHLLGLFDARPWGHLLPWRDSDDIMAEGNKVTQYDINRIISPKPPCGCN